jgi:hypothetical protein
MRQFKIIKEYPGSPRFGTIVTGQQTSIYFRYRITDDPVSKPGYSRDDIENNPEFWEEVIEKEYEILSLYQDSLPGGDIYTLLEISEKQKQFFLSQLKERNHDQFIHSVKRLSDGEIFSIGDDVTNPNCKSQTFTITKFYPDCENNHLLAGDGHINITKIEKFIKK